MKEYSNQPAGKLHSSIIESSVKESRVQLDWKRVNMMPIHTGGDKEEPLNDTPLSLTRVVAKISEGQIDKVLRRDKYTLRWSVWI